MYNVLITRIIYYNSNHYYPQQEIFLSQSNYSFLLEVGNGPKDDERNQSNR